MSSPKQPGACLTLRAALLLTLCLGAPLAAQEAKPDAAKRLAALLAELASLPAEAWQARANELAQKAEAHKQKAARLRAQAQEMLEQAEAEEKVAGQVTAAAQRLAQMLELVKQIDGKPATPAPTAPPAEKKPEVSKPVEPKAEMSPGTAAKADTPLVDWKTHVYPILAENCMSCHEASKASGGLDVSSYAAVLQGGGSGKTLVRGDPEASRLYLLVAHREQPFMPKESDKLAAQSIETIRRWIELGAPEDPAAAKAAAAKAAEAAGKKAEPKAPAGSEPSSPPAVPSGWPETALSHCVQPPPVRALAASPRAPLAAVARHDQVLVFDTASQALLGVLAFPLGRVEALRFSRDGRELLVAGGKPGKTGGAVLFDVASGGKLADFGPEPDTVLAAALSPDGALVAVGGPGKKARVYARGTGQIAYEVPHREWVLALDFSADGRHLASADRGGALVVSQARTGRNVHDLRGHTGAVPAVLFAPDSRSLASAGADGTLRTWEVESGRAQGSRPAHGGGTLGLAWGQGGLLASGGEDGRLRVWQANGQPAFEVMLGDHVYSVAFTSGGTHVVAGDWQGRASVIDVKAKKVAAVLGPAPAAPAN